MRHGKLFENGEGPSRSFWPFWLWIQGNSACLLNHSSQIWTGTTKFAPNMHHGILGWYWKWGSLTLTFKVILVILIKNSRKFGLFAKYNLKWIWVRTAKFAPNVHLWFSRLVLKMGAIDFYLQVHLGLSNFKNRHSNVAHVCWSRPDKGVKHLQEGALIWIVFQNHKSLSEIKHCHVTSEA